MAEDTARSIAAAARESMQRLIGEGRLSPATVLAVTLDSYTACGTAPDLTDESLAEITRACLAEYALAQRAEAEATDRELAALRAQILPRHDPDPDEPGAWNHGEVRRAVRRAIRDQDANQDAADHVAEVVESADGPVVLRLGTAGKDVGTITVSPSTPAACVVCGRVDGSHDYASFWPHPAAAPTAEVAEPDQVTPRHAPGEAGACTVCGWTMDVHNHAAHLLSDLAPLIGEAPPPGAPC
jgi:hypothetical protein